MKYLSHYMEERQTALFKKCGSFFAFSDRQFKESKVDGVEYVNLKHGMICPKDTTAELLKGLAEIYESAIQEDIKENGLAKIVNRELGNYECWYTGDIDPAVDALKDYPVTRDQIYKIYRMPNADADVLDLIFVNREKQES